MESVHFVTIFVKHDVMVASFSDEIRDDDKKNVILKLCQFVFMYNPKMVHVVFEHNSFPETVQWLQQFGFVRGYSDKDSHTLVIHPDLLVKKFVRGFLITRYTDEEKPGIWRATV